MNKDPDKLPFAYFITFSTYGTWLHGDKRTSVDLKHNIFCEPKIKHAPNLLRYKSTCLQQKPFILKMHERRLVLKQIINTCQYYDWDLYAAHVRSNHVHMVLKACHFPELMMTKIKAYASRTLNNQYGHKQKYWTRHGSTRYIWSSDFLFPVMRYIIEEQGEKMACFYQPWYKDYLEQGNWDY